MRVVAWIAMLALAACVTRHRVIVDSGELQRAIASLEKSGRATVVVEDLHDDETAGKKHREEVAIEQPLGAGDEKRPLSEWIRDCSPAHPSSRPCTLLVPNGFPIEVRRFETRSAKPVIGGVVLGMFATGLVGAVVCGLACADGSDAKRDSKYVLVGYGVVIGAALVTGVILCFAGRGTCRD